MADWGFVPSGQYLIYDRDGQFCPAFQQIIDAAGVEGVSLPPQSPNANADTERWVCSLRDEVLSRLMLFGERSCGTLCNYHEEYLHQSVGHLILRPAAHRFTPHGPTHCRPRHGGLHHAYELAEQVA
jgi:putative transposase